MPNERTRGLEIDGCDQPILDARAIVLGTPCADGASTPPLAEPDAPAVVWEGEVRGDGTGPQRSYYVRLYADSTGHCQCPAFYFRAVLKRNPAFACKHVIRARAAAAARTG
jgi:hypothetical protein